MKVSALASGSSGNCFYVEKDNSAILVDAGISCKQIVSRLSRIGRDASKIKGIFITHEHSDHIKGADVFAREFNIPIFATKKTAKNYFLCSDESLVNSISSDETTKIDSINVEAFSKSHKAVEPVSFSISGDKKVSVMTDAGYACSNITENISDSNMIFLESNHDIQMLENGPYPFYLKKWIKSDQGHLSNKQAGLAVLEHASSKLKSIILSHLSQTNNTPQMALNSFKAIIKERYHFNPNVLVSSREMPTDLMRV